MSRPLWGKGDRASGGRGELALNLRLPTTNAPTPTHHANKPHQTRKGIQPRKRAPPLRALTGPPLPKGRGLLYEPRLYLYRKQVNIATAKQEPEMSRPLWGKGNRASGGSGELALINRLLHKLATYPHHHRATNPHQTRKAIQYRKRAPPIRHPNGCHLSPKGEAYCMNHACIYIESK